MVDQVHDQWQRSPRTHFDGGVASNPTQSLMELAPHMGPAGGEHDVAPCRLRRGPSPVRREDIDRRGWRRSAPRAADPAGESRALQFDAAAGEDLRCQKSGVWSQCSPTSTWASNAGVASPPAIGRSGAGYWDG